MLKVAYLANRFPVAVEPYVSQEIAALRARGVEVIAGTVRRASVGPGESNLAAAADLVLSREIGVLTVFSAMWLVWHRWKQISDIVRRVLLQGGESPWQRLKALAHTALGACYAVLLKQRKVDHIHVHHGYYGSWIAMVAARLLNVDFSLTLHGSDLLLNGAYLDTKLKYCRYCVTISEYNRRFILDHFCTDPMKVMVLRLGADPDGDTSAPGQRNAKCQFTLVAAGRLHAVKDHALLIQACARLRDRGLEIECLIAGEGPERSRLQTLIRNCRLQHHVTLLGHVPRQQMNSLYRRADVFVLTSHSEGIPLVLMEAMAREKIVLAPAITGIPELVVPGKTGFLYEPGSLDDLVARLCSIHAMLRRDNPRLTGKLDWVRHAARCQALHNFNRRKNLSHFVDRFVELAARDWSLPHADSLLQQIQLPVQRDRDLPVRSHGPDAVEGTRGRVVLHGRSAG